MFGLANFLTERRAKIVREQKIERYTTSASGFGEYVTQCSFDVVDFDALMEQIAEFEASFQIGNKTDEPSALEASANNEVVNK